MEDCKARVIAARSQKEEDKCQNDSVELLKWRVLAASMSRPSCEEWFGNTGSPFI